MNRLGTIARQVLRCQKCPLSRKRTRAVPGEGKADAMLFLVGEAPGRLEDLSGRPFVGQSGRILDNVLLSVGIRREDVFITSVNKCRPPSNRKPRADEVAACRPYLADQIDAVKPRMIIALGLHSLRTLTTHDGDMSEARKEEFIYHGAPLIATYHPAAVLYNRSMLAALKEDISRAIELTGKRRSRTGGIKPVKGKGFKVRVSAGAVPWDGRRFLMIRRMEEGIWGFPKGGVETGEAMEEAALREVKEETGLEGSILSRIESIRYRFYKPESDVNFRKTVHYFLMMTDAGRIDLERGFEDFRWCGYRDALRLLHYDNDKRVLKSAKDAVRRYLAKKSIT